MKNTRVARRYARALMMTADSPEAIDTIAGDLELIEKALETSRELRLFVARPIVPIDKKKRVFQELFGSRVSTITLSFIELRTEKQRESILPEVIVQYCALRDERYGIVNVDVAGAIEITPQQQQRLAEQLERYTRKKVRLRFSIDKALQGGLRVKIGDTVLDATIKHQLELLREKLAHGQLSN
jgi:F-type H+-transporting ATPase subunit delta